MQHTEDGENLQQCAGCGGLHQAVILGVTIWVLQVHKHVRFFKNLQVYAL